MSTRISDFLIPNFNGALTHNDYIQGGVFVRNTLTQRNNIGFNLRSLDANESTLCFVVDVNTWYKLVTEPGTETTTNSNWIAISSSGDMTYQGTWNPTTNTPTLADTDTPSSIFYMVSGVPDGFIFQQPTLFGNENRVFYDGDILFGLNGAWRIARGYLGGSDFLHLMDTPDSYTGAGGNLLMVNIAESVVQFVPITGDIILDGTGEVIVVWANGYPTLDARYLQLAGGIMTGNIYWSGVLGKIGTNDANAFQVVTQNTSRISIDASGNVTHNQSVQGVTNIFQQWTQGAHTGGTPIGYRFDGGILTGLTASVETIDFWLNMNRVVNHATGNYPLQRSVFMSGPQYTFVGDSVIDAAYTLYITAPTAGSHATITDNFALGLDGHLALIVAPTHNDALTQVLARDATTGRIAYRDVATIGGAAVAPTAIKTGSYTAATGELVLVDCSSGSVPIALPAGTDGAQIGVLMWNIGGAFTCTITPNGSETINKDNASWPLTSINSLLIMQYSSARTAWLVISFIQ